LLHVNFGNTMICIAPHVWLDRLLMASDNILPVSFSELTEVKLGHFAQLAISFIVSNVSLLEILLGEVHALELVE